MTVNILQFIADNANKRGDYRIENKGDTATILAHDVIGKLYGGIDETQFTKDVADLKAAGIKNIELRVNSPGGDVFAARVMMTALANSGAKVTAYVDGLAASAATSLLMSADKIVMTRGARMMIHEAWTFELGNKRDLRAQADVLDGIDTEIAKDYAKRTGKNESDLAALMAAETWFSADQAKEAGFADEIVEPVKTGSAANKWNLGAYKNVPKELLEPAPNPDASYEAAKTQRARAERRFRLVERDATCNPK